MRKQVFIVSVLLICAVSVQAAFIVEPYDGSLGGTAGLANGNFTGTPRYSVTPGTAPGLTASHSAYGSTATDVNVDIYTYSYTPGTDADNWIVPLTERYFGNGEYSTNLTGGQTGYYNVYITWPQDDAITKTCTVEVTHDGGVETLSGLSMQTGGTSALAESLDLDPIPGTVYYGATNKWLRIGTEVLLTEGQTYTVTQTSIDSAWTSMRSAGVMWEFVAVPEPATLLLLSAGALALRRRK